VRGREEKRGESWSSAREGAAQGGSVPRANDERGTTVPENNDAQKGFRVWANL
jgi:hypothetical protein